VVAVVWVATFLAPKWYRCQAELLAKPTRLMSPLEQAGTVQNEVTMFLVTQRQVILSNYVIASALLELSGEARMPSPKGAAETMESWLRKIDAWQRQVDLYIEGDPKQDKPNHKEYISEVRRRIEVVTPSGADATLSPTFQIIVDWPEEGALSFQKGVDSAEKAAQRCYAFTNLLIRAYYLRRAQVQRERLEQAAQFMRDKALALARKAYEDAYGRLKAFVATELKGELLIVESLSGGRGGTDTGIAVTTTKIADEIARLDADLATKREMEAVIARELAKKPPQEIAVPEIVTAAVPQIDAVQNKIIALQLEANTLTARFTDDYRDVVYNREELAAARRLLERELQKQLVRVRQDIALLTARRAELQQQLGVNQQTMDRLAQLSVQYRQYKQDAEAAQAVYDAKRAAYMESETAQKLADDPVLIQMLNAPARPDPDNPRRPILWLNLLLAAIGGLLLALVYAFLADHFDHSLKSNDVAERYVGVPVLASVPKFRGSIVSRPRKGQEEDLPVMAVLSPRADEVFRGLWASLFYGESGGVRASKTVVVCAANEGEGASLVNFGLSLAGSTSGAGERVALVDFNLRNPSMHKRLKVSAAPGVAEIVLDAVDPVAAAQRVNPHLDVYTAGDVGDRGLEMMQADRLEQFLQMLRAAYDRVLLDVAAVNEYPDARILVAQVRDAVLVARAGATPREAVAQAKRSLDAAGARVLGLVLNQRTYPIPRSLYQRI